MSALLLAMLLSSDAPSRFYSGDHNFRVEAGYSHGNYWAPPIGAITGGVEGGAFVGSTLYETLFGIEGRVRLGYPWLPSVMSATIEVDALLAPLWVRFGDSVVRLTGLLGAGIGGPPAGHTLAGARLEFVSDFFGLMFSACWVPTSGAKNFEWERRIEVRVSFDALQLGFRWTAARFAYADVNEKGEYSENYPDAIDRSSLGGYIGWAF